MEYIKYKCNRCNKIVDALLYKAEFKRKRKKSRTKGFHYRLDCCECNKYIKFVGERELSTLVIDPGSITEKPSIEKNSPKRKTMPKKEGGLSEHEIMNFKLDLIIDHLGIKNG